MSVAWFLAIRHVVHSPLRSTILSLCIAFSVFLPFATRVIVARYRSELTSRADATPMALAARGSQLDLALLSMYFRSTSLPTISMADAAALRKDVQGLLVPIHARFTARNVRIVATSHEYFEARDLHVAGGSLPRTLGEVVLGARAARTLALREGDALFSDQTELYDISKPPALKMHICGVLDSSGSADDETVFVDLKTAWILEGLSHGHAEPKALPASMILDRSEQNVVVSEQLIHYNEVTLETASTFHLHAAPEQLPLSAILFFPMNAREGTIVKARVNEGNEDQLRRLQAIVPREVVDELLAVILRLRLLIDMISILLGATTSSLVVLIFTLSTRVRERELLTLRRVGAPASVVRNMIGFECLIVLGLGVCAASILLFVLLFATPRLMNVLS